MRCSKLLGFRLSLMACRRFFNRDRNWCGSRRLRGLGFGVGGLFLSLEQATEGYPVVLFLVTLLVSVGAELSSAPQPFQQRQLFAAVEASHMDVIGVLSQFVKALSGCFYTVKRLSRLSQVSSLCL